MSKVVKKNRCQAKSQRSVFSIFKRKENNYIVSILYINKRKRYEFGNQTIKHNMKTFYVIIKWHIFGIESINSYAVTG